MLSRLSFQARLILMMCISFGLFAVLGGTGLVAVGKVNQSLDRIYQEKHGADYFAGACAYQS